MKLVKVTKKDSKNPERFIRHLNNVLSSASKEISDAAMHLGIIQSYAKDLDLQEAEGLLDDAQYFKIENNIKVCLNNFYKMKKALEAAG